MSKIVTKQLSKVFGPRPGRALEHLRGGGSKDEVQEKYGLAVGVHNISLDVQAGETFVLMGLSGSGKSTLLRLLNRLHEPTAGEIVIDGIEVHALRPKALRAFRREKFGGMVFQQFGILPHRTVLANVEFGLELQGVSRQKRQARAREMLELVGLSGWEESYSSQLSGGMQQRVGLARALAVDADILLMDEAFSALDPLIRREMQDELLALQARMNKTIVFVTHDLDEALKLGDRIAIMRDAGIVQVGTAEEIIAEPANDYVEAFVEGIDRTEVLRAATIMQPPKVTAHLRDGPRTALHKMQKHGISGILVVDSERHLKGYLEAERLAAHIETTGGKGSIERPLLSGVVTVAEDATLNDIIGLASKGVGPVAVVDERERLKGVIVKGAILAALSRRGPTRPSEQPPPEVALAEGGS